MTCPNEISAVLGGESQGCVVCGEALEVLAELPPRCCGAIVMDPPFMFTTASAGCGKLNPWADMMNGSLWFKTLLLACERICPDGYIWEFCNWRTVATLQKAGFDARIAIESLLIWDKMWIAAGGSRGLHPAYEAVALFLTGNATIVNRGIPDIVRCQWSSHKPNGHPAEKPQWLCERLIEWAGDPEIIVDPFAGSGSVGAAAKVRGSRYIGIECDEAWATYARARLAATPKPLFQPEPEKAKQGMMWEEAKWTGRGGCLRRIPLDTAAGTR